MAKRSIGIQIELQMRPVENCAFCAYREKAPKGRIEHGCGAASAPNSYPWEEYDWITIYPPFAPYKLLLSELHFDDMERMIESAYDLAMICANYPAVIYFMDFGSWGCSPGYHSSIPIRNVGVTPGFPAPACATRRNAATTLWNATARIPSFC